MNVTEKTWWDKTEADLPDWKKPLAVSLAWLFGTFALLLTIGVNS
jgi:type IV secretory pathway component VirB8